MIPVLLQSVDSKELEVFCSDCISGRVYDVFIKNLIPTYTHKELHTYGYSISRSEYDYSYKMKRSIVKKRLLAFLFDDNGGFEDVGNVFKELYPTVFSLLWKIKLVDYRKLSHLLFSCEAFCMYKFSKEMNRIKGGKMPIFLLHDCVVVQKGNESFVHDYLQKAFTDFLGESPKLSIEFWEQK